MDEERKPQEEPEEEHEPSLEPEEEPAGPVQVKLLLIGGKWRIHVNGKTLPVSVCESMLNELKDLAEKEGLTVHSYPQGEPGPQAAQTLPGRFGHRWGEA